MEHIPIEGHFPHIGPHVSDARLGHTLPDQKRLTWFYPDFGSYVVKEYITPEQLAVRVRSIERQEAARAHKEAKRQPPIAEQLKAAQREAQEHRAPDGPKKKAPDRGDR